jgi:hypothetical protein
MSKQLEYGASHRSKCTVSADVRIEMYDLVGGADEGISGVL